MAEPFMIRVVIADDHYLVRQAIRALLENAWGIEVVGEARDGQEVIQIVNEVNPDVVVMDISMPEKDGIMATSELQEQESPPRVVILSMYGGAELVERAVRNGALAYLLKRSTAGELVQAVRSAVKGKLFVGSRILPIEREKQLRKLVHST